ncbi:MAG TPA: ABC transporter permease [Thermoanaerobaculia bacterium]|nr:ABC transporter permease [Thermoanaerobaculia bacterium]
MSQFSPMRQDLRYALRTIRRRPAFAAVVIATLALGIGANTALFSVVNAVLLAPLPFREPERIFMVWASNPPLAQEVGLPDELPASPGQFTEWQAQSRSFESLTMMQSARFSLTGGGEPRMLDAVQVTGRFFDVFGTPPALGRTLQAADDAPGRDGVVVLSDAFWRDQFGADPGIVGRKLLLDGAPVEVVGVMPPEFAFPRGSQLPAGYGFAERPDLWRPLGLDEAARQQRGNHSLLVVGRLRPGVDPEAAQAEMETISAQLAERFPDSDRGWSARLEPLSEQLVGGLRPALLVLLAAVGMVLLIACANVANLFLAQAVGRQKEISIRTALGARRGRLVRQLLTESLILSLVGGAVGLLAAYWGLKAFAAWVPSNVPLPRDLGTAGIDLTVLIFTVGLALLTGALAGLAPALQTTRPDLAESLREGTRAGSGASRGGRTRNALVVLEVAVALLLVVGAGLLVRSFARLTAIDPGFRPENVLTLEIDVPTSKYPRDRRAAFFERVIEELRGQAGVVSVGAVSSLPMSGVENVEALYIEGRPEPEPEKTPLADFRMASPGYFDTLGIPLQRGRLFAATDTAESTKVAVIDEEMAATYWPDADPIGQRFRVGGPNNANAPIWTVVGIVGNVRHSGLHVQARPQLYVPQVQRSSSIMAIAVRTERDPEALIPAARAAVRAVDPDQPISVIRTMDEVVSASVAGRRFNMVLLGVLAALALVLSAVGIYGVTSYSVSQRTREMGLRMALGARRGQVLGMVVAEAGRLAVLGVICGLVLAFLATRVMASLLFGVQPTDPVTFAAVALGLALIAMLAAWLPGRRATGVDPMVALRSE